MKTSSVTYTQCSIDVQPASTATLADSAECAYTMVRRPSDLASPHTASACSFVTVMWPPSRILFEADSLMKSAPCRFLSRTTSRIIEGSPLFR
jgi:hypothetical protein